MEDIKYCIIIKFDKFVDFNVTKCNLLLKMEKQKVLACFEAGRRVPPSFCSVPMEDLASSSGLSIISPIS